MLSPYCYFITFHITVVENYDTSRPIMQDEVRIKISATGICGRYGLEGSWYMVTSQSSIWIPRAYIPNFNSPAVMCIT